MGPLIVPPTVVFTGIDNLRPSIIGRSPNSNAQDVPVTTTVSATFSEPMDPLSINSSTLSLNVQGVPVQATIALSANNTVATFTPANPLFAGRGHSTSFGSTIRDLAGNGLTNPTGTFFTTAQAPGTSNLPTSAAVTTNPASVFANGLIPTTVTISNIRDQSGVLVPNGTIIAVTAQPVFNLSSVGGTISGPTVGISPDGRFLLFSTLGAEVTLSYTPPDRTDLSPGSTVTGVVQVASVDLDNRPVNRIGFRSVTLFGVNSAGVAANPTVLPADGVSTSTLTVTVRDRNNNLVPDGTRVGLTALPVFSSTTAGGTITDGTTSTGDPRLQLFTTTGGPFTATYQSPARIGSGTAIVQVMTVDRAGHPTGLAGFVTITVQ